MCFLPLIYFLCDAYVTWHVGCVTGGAVSHMANGHFLINNTPRMTSINWRLTANGFQGLIPMLGSKDCTLYI